MELDKFKKLLLSVIIDFLIADYSSWKILGNFISDQQKSLHWLKKNINKLLRKKEAKFSE